MSPRGTHSCGGGLIGVLGGRRASVSVAQLCLPGRAPAGWLPERPRGQAARFCRAPSTTGWGKGGRRWAQPRHAASLLLTPALPSSILNSRAAQPRATRGRTRLPFSWVGNGLAEDSYADHTVCLGEALRRYLAQRRMWEVSCAHLVPVIWPQVVGEWYARHTEVVRVWEGIVEVRCDSAARAQQLQLDSEEIMRRLNERLGQPYVRQIRPSTAGFVRPSRASAPGGRRELPTPSAAELESLPLTAAEEQWIAACAAPIASAEARQAYEKALRAYLRLRHWRLQHGWQPCPRCGELYHSTVGCCQCSAAS
jgi:predicted nucleic acid-binding Zn ribbon protein